MSEEKKQIINPKDVKVDANHLRINGVMLRGDISPFDIPKEVIANYDSERRRFFCTLIYLTEESLEREFVARKEESSLYFYFGKNSGKLYRIEIDNIDQNKIPNITIQVTLGIDKKIDSKSKNDSFESASSILNLMSAKKAFEVSQIFKSFASAT